MPKAEKAKPTPGPATKMIDRMYPNRIALSDNVKAEAVQILQGCLANAADTYSQAKFAHWNVKGENFYQLHLLFDHVAEIVGAQVDPIAERLTQLGGVANGTSRQTAKGSSIPEYNVDAVNGMEHVKALSEAVGHYAQSLRQSSEKIDELGDKPTADFFNQMIVDVEEQMYFLESHLEAGKVP